MISIIFLCCESLIMALINIDVESKFIFIKNIINHMVLLDFFWQWLINIAVQTKMNENMEYLYSNKV